MRSDGIDWTQARNRLRTNERALEEALEAGPEQIELVYRQRAALLAKQQAEHEKTETALPVLILRLAKERYAIELAEVAEVIRFEHCTAVPGAPPLFRGVMNLHGELCPVLELSSLLAPAETERNDAGFVLALRGRDQEIGFRVDDVEELSEVFPERTGLPSPGNYLKAGAAGTPLLLDVEKVLAGVFPEEELTTT